MALLWTFSIPQTFLTVGLARELSHNHPDSHFKFQNWRYDAKVVGCQSVLSTALSEAPRCVTNGVCTLSA
jgi:hypothetical protein